MKKNNSFAGIPEEFTKLDRSKIVLIPVPYDGTSTWQKGANRGFKAFSEASENMELYDIETSTEVYKQGIYTADPVTENRSPETMVESVHQTVKDYINRNKFVTIFGGEHSISIGAIRAFNECFENLTVLQIDAHADLRKIYEGSSCNHACAVYEANELTNLIQVGIRSMDISEKNVMNTDKVFFAHEMSENYHWMDNAIDLMTENVYITFDLDALDPSIMPSTGTPEPGGLLWQETLDFLKKVFYNKNVVGFDIVELCPNENNKAPDFLAAKLYYKMLSYKFYSEDNDEVDLRISTRPVSKLTKFKNDEY
ncbi:MAG: agmatinase [Flavobacteriales bacterium]|tara:strand:- start:2094 stop:3026 length:933 start_codon:yes stop_codon:yes gene_type:complete